VIEKMCASFHEKKALFRIRGWALPVHKKMFAYGRTKHIKLDGKCTAG